MNIKFLTRLVLYTILLTVLQFCFSGFALKLNAEFLIPLFLFPTLIFLVALLALFYHLPAVKILDASVVSWILNFMVIWTFQRPKIKTWMIDAIFFYMFIIIFSLFLLFLFYYSIIYRHILLDIFKVRGWVYLSLLTGSVIWLFYQTHPDGGIEYALLGSRGILIALYVFHLFFPFSIKTKKAR